MADNVINPLGSPTTNFGWTKPTVGGDPDVWGGYINSDLDSIDTAVFGMLPKTGGTMTGALTPSQTAGIVGTTTNNNANAGAIGEYQIASKMTNIAMTNNVAFNIISVSLTAGDWDVSGLVSMVFSVGGQEASAQISLTSANIAGSTYEGAAYVSVTGQTLSTVGLATTPMRVSIAATTTVYLCALSIFSSGNCQGQGTIRARRVR